MQTASGAFATSVLLPDQVIAYSVMVTLPGSVQASFGDLSNCVETMEFYQQVTSSLPAGTSMISGYPSVQPKLTLSGPLYQGDGVALNEAQSVYWLFNPNDPTSPMWQQSRLAIPITISMGLYDGAGAPELIRKFTGVIDQITCSKGLVTLTCRDRRATITNQATLPPVITGPPYNSGLTSEFAVDYLLRHASPAQYLSWPAQRPNCIFAAGMRSSIWAEKGTYNLAYGHTAPGFVFGSRGSMALLPVAPIYTMAGSVPVDAQGFIEFRAKRTGADVVVAVSNDPATYSMILWVSSAGVFCQTQSPGGASAGIGFNIDTTIERTYALQFKWLSSSTSVAIQIWADTTTLATTVTAIDARPVALNTCAVQTGPIAEVQVTTETDAVVNPDVFFFTPTLALDPSLNALTALPDVSGKDTWAVLQDIAAAESAVIGFDETGLCRFTNRRTIQTKTSQRTITSAQSLQSLDSNEQMSLCATHIQVPVNQIQVGPLSTVWAASSVLVVDPGVPLVFIASTSQPVVNVATTDDGFYPGVGPAIAGHTYWQASRTLAGDVPVLTGISVSVVQLSPSQLQVTVTNSSGMSAALVTPIGYGTAGKPSLIIGGQLVLAVQTAIDGSIKPGAVSVDVQWPPVSSGGAVTNPVFGEVLLQIPANGWLQDTQSAQAFAADMLADLAYPKPMYTNVAIIPDPRLQLVDRVTLADPDISQISDDALLFGIDTRISNGQYVQNLDARAWARPGAWLLGVVGRSELSTTTFIY